MAGPDASRHNTSLGYQSRYAARYERQGGADPHGVNPIQELQTVILRVDHHVRRQDIAVDQATRLGKPDDRQHSLEDPAQVTSIEPAGYLWRIASKV